MSAQEDKPVETPKAWYRLADEDLTVVEREMSSAHPSFHTVCFLCQSASEKYLKGYLIAQGWELERTHDIVALLGWCSDYTTGRVREGCKTSPFMGADTRTLSLVSKYIKIQFFDMVSGSTAKILAGGLCTMTGKQKTPGVTITKCAHLEPNCFVPVGCREHRKVPMSAENTVRHMNPLR